jgi:hypothetical protein
MAGPKIKKKSSVSKASPMPRQGAIPCLILLLIILAVIGFFFFASFHGGGS